SAPVIDELSERTGNITLVVRSATTPKPTLGASVGWHAVVRAVGVRPWWLYVPVDRWQRQYDVRGPARRPPRAGHAPPPGSCCRHRFLRAPPGWWRRPRSQSRSPRRGGGTNTSPSIV